MSERSPYAAARRDGREARELVEPLKRPAESLVLNLDHVRLAVAAACVVGATHGAKRAFLTAAEADALAAAGIAS